MGEVLLRSSSENSEPWQGSIKNLKDKWLYVWQNGLFTDVNFKVGSVQEIISCHKILLILHSPVFETMLSLRWSDPKETNQLEIQLPEEEPEIFKILLEFVYTGAISTTEIDQVVSTLLLGKKYLCTHLIEKCIELLKDSLSVTNVMQIYQVAEMLDEVELKKTSEDYILHNANSLLLSGEINKMNKTDLCKMLESDELNVVEIDLFNAVYSWGKSECLRVNTDPNNPSDIVEILRDLLPFIRFTNMNPEDFSCQIVPKNILPLEDTVTIFRYLTTPQEKKPDIDMKFNTTKRSLSYFVYNLRRLKGHGFDYGLKWQNFCFKTDRDVRIISLGFFRAIEPDAVLEVGIRIQNVDLTEIFAEITQQNIKVPVGEDVFHVKFKQPIKITKETLYTISYVIRGKETFYKPASESSIKANCGSEGSVMFKFTNALNDTDLDQVPEICFRL